VSEDGPAHAQRLRQARSYLRAADPVLARLIDSRPDFDPRATSTLGFMAAARGAAIDIVDRVMSNPHQLLTGSPHRFR
jgi:hypothetical protein